MVTCIVTAAFLVIVAADFIPRRKGASRRELWVYGLLLAACYALVLLNLYLPGRMAFLPGFAQAVNGLTGQG